MRASTLWVIIALFVTAAYAWTKEDHEIFDLVGDVEASEGKGTTFYSWLEVSPTATSAEIGKAYRKKSMVLHPDKNPGVKGVSERFARLGVVSQILRNAESRKRYDFFYKNGVPKWRGTGYYYSRFRPGLGTVFVFLVILTSGVQYLVQKMNYDSDIKRVHDFIKRAQEKAWGAAMIPLQGRRKVKIPVGKVRYNDEGEPIQGKILDMIVDPDAVYILEPDGQLLPLDATVTRPPTLTGTWAITLLASVAGAAVHRARGKSESASAQEGVDRELTDESDGSGTEPDIPSGSQTPPTRTTARQTTKVGGQRRKNTRRR